MRISKTNFPLLIPLCITASIFVGTILQKKSFSSLEEPWLEKTRGTELPLRLLGTIIGSESLAFINNNETGKNTICKVNDFILGFRITDISCAKVTLEKGDSTQELALTGEKRNSLEFISGEDTLNTIVLNKSLLLKQLPHANELLSKIKVFPIAKLNSSQLEGFRIDNVPAGSILEDVGFRSGDIICAVEGKELKSMEDAWKIFNSVKSQSYIEIALVRADKPLTLKYHIRNQ